MSGSTSNGIALPSAANATSSINMSGTTGKVALANTTSTVTYTAPNTFSSNVVDFVGFGTANAYEGGAAAPAPSTTTSIRRKDNSGNSSYYSGANNNGSGWDTGNNSTDFFLANLASTDGPLPVELSSFSSTVYGQSVQLDWATATEVNSYLFIVQRCEVNSDVWIQVGEVLAANNSNSPKDYSFSDGNVNPGSYLYRLKMVDQDGTYTYSSTTSAVVMDPDGLNLSQNYPNPFNPSTKITYTVPADGNIKLELFTITGVKIADLVNETVSAGYYEYRLDMNVWSLASGSYFYKLSTTSNSNTKTSAIVKKLIYLK